MKNYVAIPASSHASPVVDVESITRDDQRIKAGIAPLRPWNVMFDFQSTWLPRGVSDAFSRIKTNLRYFQRNYVIVVLIVVLIFNFIIIFDSLIKYPISLIGFTALNFLWIFYLLRNDEPIKLFGYRTNDLIVRSLTLITVALLLLTNATFNISRPLLIGYVVVLIHAVVRKTEDLFLDEEAAMPETS
uniref:PRA1 family protein n=1 Tax=Noccaea caerulescens TaxID=107243 RepID=A0A1J3G3V1_NOCCA